MAKDTFYSASVRAVKSFLGKKTTLTTWGELKYRMDEIRKDPSLHGQQVDSGVAAVFLGLSTYMMSILKKIDPPPAPFVAERVVKAPVGKRGRPPKRAGPITTVKTSPGSRRGKGKPPELATIGQVIEWFDKLEKANAFDPDKLRPYEIDPKTVLDTTLAAIPVLMGKRKADGAEISLGAFHALPLHVYGKVLLDAHEQYERVQLAFLPLESALLDYEWADQRLQIATAKIYTDHLENHAKMIFQQVNSSTQKARLHAKTVAAKAPSRARRGGL